MIERNCLVCNKKFFVYPSKLKQYPCNYCSLKCSGIENSRRVVTEETRIHISLGLMGHSVSKDARIKMSNSKKGKSIPWINNKGHIAWNKGKKLPQYSGENSPVWKGGFTKETIKRTTTPEWKSKRLNIYKRDNYSCRNCGKKCHTDIQCHHIIPYRISNGDVNKPIFWNTRINDEENLITLCKHCHAIIENETRKKEKEGNYGFNTLFRVVSCS